MSDPAVPRLSLFFDEKFGDSLWANKTFRLEAPERVRGEWVIGRSPGCDLVIRLREVSVRHAVIAYSYARNSWTLTDLDSTNGTFHNRVKLLPRQAVELNIGDRINLCSEGRIQVVEDDYDTVRTGDTGPSTVGSTTPLAVAPAPAPAPAPPSRTYADSLYLFAQWLVTAQTKAGKVYRLMVAALAVVGFIFMVNWLTQ